MKNYYYTIKPNLLDNIESKNKSNESLEALDMKVFFIRLLLFGICFYYYHTILGKIGFFIFLVSLIVLIYEANKKTLQNRKNEENEFEKKNWKIKNENKERINLTNQMSFKLNETLSKSEDLLQNGIPLQLDNAKNVLEKIKFEFKENALIPFWDEVENFVEVMNSYQDSLQIIETNQKTYYSIINSTENDFPKEFSTKIDQTIPLKLINDFKTIQREAFKKFEFANLWEQRKTQKILAFGFSNLQDAIYNMSDSITFSINGLNDSIISLNNNIVEGFKTLSNDINSIYIDNRKVDMSTTNKILEDNLTRIDKKLYYIQYNRKPFKPFNDYLAPER